MMDPLGSESDPYWKRQEELKDPNEEHFNNGVREITILVLTGMVLYTSSYYFLLHWRRRRDKDEEFIPFSWEDEIVYKISFSICSFCLAVSIGASLLLPISTISNEILHRYPSSWYIKWLNSSLIHGIWNLIFVMSNVSLFLLLPFAYLFCESEGLPFFGNKRGLMARAKETGITLLLLSLTVWGMMYVIAALIDRDKNSIDTILNVYSYLPFLYSCVSFLGVLMLLICTPLGFARLFTIVGDLVTKPTFMRNLDEEYFNAKFEEESLAEKLKDYEKPANGRMAPILDSTGRRLKNGEVIAHLQLNLAEVTQKRQTLDRARKTPGWLRILGYPLVMLFLLTLTSLALICVIWNVSQILAGSRSLPIYHQTSDLGLSSLSSFGVLGVLIEVILIGYLMVTSLIGLYTIPLVKQIKPSVHGTSLTHLILNSGIFVILSSALPLLSKILGITNFDLLGSFGEVKWLGDFYLVLLYNAVFAGAAGLCLFNKFTARVREEIVRRIQLYISTLLGHTLDKNKKLGMVTTPLTTSPPINSLKSQ